MEGEIMEQRLKEIIDKKAMVIREVPESEYKKIEKDVEQESDWA